MKPWVAQLLATLAGKVVAASTITRTDCIRVNKTHSRINISAGASTFGWGCAIGLSAVIIPQLRDEKNGLAWGDSDLSW